MPTPIDYQSAQDAYRKEEHTPDNPVRTSGLPALNRRLCGLPGSNQSLGQRTERQI